MTICLLSVVGTTVLSLITMCLCSNCLEPKEIDIIPPYEENPPAYIEVDTMS